MDDFQYSSSQLQQLRKRLRDWYGRNHRLLPWRETRDPYRIWLSEIMLQQTTVAAVVPYFDRFLERFPTVHDLAAGDVEDVLRLWEGLGYYSRARNIHKAAREVVDSFDGQFPSAPEELVKLPGIGRYTAGAIASFAFELPAPIVEANTQRLYARLLGWDQPLDKSASQKMLWSFAEHLVPDKQPGLFNQALMDLGSQICTPVDPKCKLCPLSRFCSTFATDRQAEIPAPKKKTPPTPVTHLCVAVRKGNSYLLQQYQEGERWAGLWDFPRWESETFNADRLPSKTKPAANVGLFASNALHDQEFAQAAEEFGKQFGGRIQIERHVTTIRHAVTRYAITLVCFEATTRAKHFPESTRPQKWIAANQLTDIPFSTTGRKLATLLTQTNRTGVKNTAEAQSTQRKKK